MNELHNNDALWAYVMRASEELWMLDRQHLNDDTIYHLLCMGIYDWKGEDNLLNQAGQAVHLSLAMSTRFVEVEPWLNSSNCLLHRLLMRLMKEERRDRLEANTNVHIQHVIKKMAQVNSNMERLIRKNENHKMEIQHLVTEQDKQEAQSSCLEEGLKAMEDLMEDQAMKIIGLEEEVAILRSRKACTCGKRVVTMSGSGSQEDPLTLEYAEDEGSNSGSSYHSPIMAQEELLLVIGSLVAQSPNVPDASCAYPVPEVIRIADDVEMTVVPSENEEAIPVPPRYSMGSQRASRGHPVAHYHSSTHHTNRHTKQLSSHPYHLSPCFMDQDLRFPCTSTGGRGGVTQQVN